MKLTRQLLSVRLLGRKILFKYQIYATDISTKVLKICEEGRYKGRPIARFQKARPDLFDKYMMKNSDDTYSVEKRIRKNISFEQHNLFETLSSNKEFDMLFLRNVLIYFKLEDQKKVVRNIRMNMKKDCKLVIGESESLALIDKDFINISPFVYSTEEKNEQRLAA